MKSLFLAVILIFSPLFASAQVAKIVVDQKKCGRSGCTTARGYGTANYLGERDGLQWWSTAAHCVAWPGHSFQGATIIQPNTKRTRYERVTASLKLVQSRNDIAILVTRQRPTFKPFRMRITDPRPGEMGCITGFPAGGKKRFQAGRFATSGFTNHSYVVDRRPAVGESGGAVTDHSGRLLGSISAYPMRSGRPVDECLYTPAKYINQALKDLLSGRATSDRSYKTFGVPNYRQVCDGAYQSFRGCRNNEVLFNINYGRSHHGQDSRLWQYIIQSTLRDHSERIIANAEDIKSSNQQIDENGRDISVLKQQVDQLNIKVFGGASTQPVTPAEPPPATIQGNYPAIPRESSGYGNRLGARVYPPGDTGDPNPSPPISGHPNDYALILQVYRGGELIIDTKTAFGDLTESTNNPSNAPPVGASVRIPAVVRYNR